MYKDLKTDEQKYSYCLALDLVARVSGLPVKLDKAAFLDAVSVMLNDGKPDIDNEEYQKVMTKLYKELEAKRREHDKENADAKAAGDAFRAENAKKTGVKTTASGLQYEILVEGKGKSPKATDTVKVHYEGTLISGKVFDSSYKRGEPLEFPLNRVIPGWTEGLQLMKVGATYQFVIPPELAYGHHGAGAEIPPDSTLIFKVELLGIR